MPASKEGKPDKEKENTVVEIHHCLGHVPMILLTPEKLPEEQQTGKKYQRKTSYTFDRPRTRAARTVVPKSNVQEEKVTWRRRVILVR